MLSKQTLVQAIQAQLQKEFATISQAAQAAHEAATHEESKPEDSHDTRGLEASYLAGAQANRAAELKNLITLYNMLPIKDFSLGDPIDLGALIELELDNQKSLYFLVSQGGGLKVKLEGRLIQVITPQAPLGDALIGKKSGDAVEVEVQNRVREYEVTGVY